MASDITKRNLEIIRLSKSPFVIAIDGPAASGKGTIGRRLAAVFDLNFLDTGSLYREVAYKALLLNMNADDESQMEAIANRVRPGLIDPVAIRSSAVANLAPKIAAMPRVRRALLGIQREFSTTGVGAVLDGRDIGTVVCPDADVKLFITAAPDVRAMRRRTELLQQGETISLEDVLKDIRSRDDRDSNRSVSPLIPAADAVVIDTSEMTVDEALGAAIAAVNDA